jgi:transcription initiation factor TFIIH subunit 4
VTGSTMQVLLRMYWLEQIITFLTSHAHPQMQKQVRSLRLCATKSDQDEQDPLLPPTITDQIRLWELEKNRVQDASGYLYEAFHSAADFHLVKDYAQQLGIVLWMADPEAAPPNCWKLFVTEEGHLLVKVRCAQ